MKKHYLHISVYRCDNCQGPVVSGSLAARESEISKEIEKREIGAICLSCGRRPSEATAPGRARHLLPIDWQPPDAIDAGHVTTALVKALDRATL
jgi:hypothetical protein